MNKSESVNRSEQENRQKRLYIAGCNYTDAGLSFLPIGINKEPFFRGLPRVFDKEQKRDKATWKPFQDKQPTQEQIYEWFVNMGAPGIAILGGKVSGNLEILDIEGSARNLWSQICKALDDCLPGLVERLFVIETPSGGFHIPYRCNVIGGCDKYALRPEDVPKGTPGARRYQGRWVKFKTLIEIKGEGGYVLSYPSSSVCHPSGKEYIPLAGDWLAIPILAVHERQALLDIAASFNEIEKEAEKTYTPSARQLQPKTGLRPGDDFNLRASWADVLEPFGWTYQGQSYGIERWKRPGETSNKHQASVIYGDQGGWFTCFSENVSGFEVKKAYYKFATYTILRYGLLTSDTFKLSTKDLAAQGYGDLVFLETQEEDYETTPEKVAFNQVVLRMFAYWNITDKSFRTFIAFDSLTVGFKSKRLAGEDVARQIRTRFCEGKEENASDFGNRRMRELISELKEAVNGKIISVKEHGGKPLKWDVFGQVLTRSITRYEIDRSIINEALALAEKYINENVCVDLPPEIRSREEVRAREKAATEIAIKYAKNIPQEKVKRAKNKDAYTLEMDGEIGFKKNIEKVADAWIEMGLTEVERLARWGRLVSIGNNIIEEKTSSEVRKLKRKGRKKKTNIVEIISPRKKVSNSSREEVSPPSLSSKMTPSS